MRGLTVGYVARRLALFVLTVWLGATIIFIIPRLAPGDPISAMVSRMQQQAGTVANSAELIEAWRKRFGLDDPQILQYLKFMKGIVTFDLGPSLASFPTEVNYMIRQRLPWTIGLLTLATFMAFVIGNLIGALMAWRKTPAFIRNALPLSLTFTSIPFYLAGLLLIFLFAFGLDWLPVGQSKGRGVDIALTPDFVGSVIKHGTLPALSIVITSMGFWALGMRGMMITTEGEDYMVLASAKGLRPLRIFLLYGMRNAILPQVTALATAIGAVVGGSVIVELIFAYQGIGYLLYQGIVTNDFTVIQGIVFVLVLATALAVLFIDLLYPFLDPRISYRKT